MPCNNPSILLRIPNWELRKKFYMPLPFWTQNFKNCHVKDGALFEFFTLDSWEKWRPYFESYPVYFKDFIFRIPCRKCVGCKIDKKNQFTARCIIESKMHRQNVFITLTYDDDHLKSPELLRRDYQLFMKRLRKYASAKTSFKPLQYYRGEYGERTHRPHFHAILFDFDLPDKEVLYWKTKRGRKVYHAVSGAVPYFNSQILRGLWKKGNVIISSVTPETCRYVANYLDKGSPLLKEYVQPFNGISTRPGIGRAYFNYWLNRDMDRLYDVVRLKLPVRSIQYYRRLLKELCPDDYRDLKMEHSRVAEARDRPWEKISITETEYLKRREDRIIKAVRLFRKKEDFSL